MSINTMKFSEMPDWTRVKLDDEGERELWHRVNEFGGVKAVSNAFDLSASKLYNWKSKSSYLPIDFVKRLMGNEASDNVVAVKGRGRSNAVKNPEIPVPENDELLTRVNTSVVVNRDGTPVYQARERSLADRFDELLQELGDVPTTIYTRELQELRFPKFVYELLSEIEYEEDFAALVDEEGEIGEKIRAGGKEVHIEEFDGRLYSRDKRLELALRRNDSDEISKLIAEEASKVRSFTG